MKCIIVAVAAVSVTLLFSACTAQKTDEEAEISPIPAAANLAAEKTEKPSEEFNLTILSEPEIYAYNDFMTDAASIQKRYGDIVQPVKVCDTADGRSVCDIIIGDQKSEKQILIFGAMHAREYITSQIVMRQLCECIDIISGNSTGEYKGVSKKELMDGVTIHFIPMSNPDGVSISQLGLDGILKPEIKNSVINMGVDDYVQWKSNAEGVDINRNFDAGWEEYSGASMPGGERYKGTSPGSSAEAAGIIKLTEDYRFKRTISYHTCGSLIYWYYKQSGGVLEKSQAFANSISEATGYVIDENYQSVDAAGYKDWAVYKKGIPSITIEIGAEDGADIINPVPAERFRTMWERNKNVVFAALYDLKYGDS